MSKIKWDEPIETITGVPITVVDGPDSSGNRKIRSGNDFLDDYLDWTDADGRILGIKKLGPLIRNVAAPAEPVKLSDGSVIRGGWLHTPDGRGAVKLSFFGGADLDQHGNVMFGFIGIADQFATYSPADARVIAAAIGLDIDAMIGGSK